MAKEYSGDQITPENAEAKIQALLKEALVGSVEYIAFRNALEWRKASNGLLEHRRVLEITESGAEIPDQVTKNYGSRTVIESDLRTAEARKALADFEISRNGCSIPGFTNVMLYSMELLEDYEEHIKQTEKFDMGDQALNELRGRAEALDYASESAIEVEMSEPSLNGHWLIGLLKKFK